VHASDTVTLCGETLQGSTHVCAFFDAASTKYRTLAPFIDEGLGADERVLSVVDAAKRADHLRSLIAEGVDVEPALGRQQFQVLTSEETYVRDGEFHLDDMLTMLERELADTQARGTRLRTWGEMDWISRDGVDPKRAIEYEARVNAFLPRSNCVMVCVYDLNSISATLVTDILATHPHAVINGRLRANPYYVAPEAYFADFLSAVKR
jgi:hypothetical protein